MDDPGVVAPDLPTLITSMNKALDEWVSDCECDCKACDELLRSWRDLTDD